MLSTGHLIVVLGIVVLVFGTKKLRHLGEDLGGAIRGFKKGMKEENDASEKIEEKTINELNKNPEEKNIN